MKAVFLITVTALAMLAELLAGNVGIYLPLTAYAVFYFTCSISAAAGVAAAIVAGTVLDLIYGRTLLLTPLILLAALAAGWSLRRNQMETLLEAALPGMAIGATAALGAAALRMPGGQPPSWLLLWQAVWFGSIGLLLLPLTVFVLDSAARTLGLPEFLKETRSRLNRNPLGSRPRRVRERLVTPNRRKEGE